MIELVNSLALGLGIGSLYAMLGVSFSLIFTSTKILHLAHGAVFTLAAYASYAGIALWGLPIPVALALSVGVAMAVGAAIELFIYRPLRKRNATHLIVFIASASVLGLVQAVVAVLFGTAHVALPLPIKPAIEGLTLTDVQVLNMVVALVIIVPLAIVLQRTSWGVSLRAVGDAPGAALRRGVNIPRVYLVSFLVGSALLVPAAFLQGWAVGLRPEMGFHAALIATAATLVAGSRGVLFTAAVGLGLGVVQGLSLLVVPSGWQEGVTFLVLFLAVVVPQFSKKRKAVVA